MAKIERKKEKRDRKKGGKKEGREERLEATQGSGQMVSQWEAD
jgi:hypothetical protein